MSVVRTPVSRLAQFVNGRAFKPDDFTDEGLAVVRIRELLNPEVEPDRFDGAVSERNRIQNGDLLFAWSATLAVRFWNRGDAVLNQHLFNVIPHPGVSKPYLRWALDHAIEDLAGHMHGSAMTHITLEMLKNVYVALPTAVRQQRIAEYLDQETGQIDALITKQEQLVQMLTERRQAVITHAVTRGLDPTVQLVDSGIPWLGQVPRDWSLSRMKYLVTERESGTSVNAMNVPAASGEVAVLKTGSASTGVFDASNNKVVLEEDLGRVTCAVRQGKIIINRANSPELVGSAALVRDTHENLYLSDKLWQLGFTSDSTFTYWWFQTRTYKDQVSALRVGTSSSMQNLAYDDFKEIQLAYPALAVQQRIGIFVDAETSKIDSLIAKSREVVAVLKERRQAQISAAVTGKIDVRGL